ncbi:sensor histidine kinase [Halovivax gelatinilyticus]|uniref:sensor histidine kinase n=1 Tax=Halovivax gelatinilyticus TaxID=2961597 RepID=UPI0020CA833D|nr:ATP-binding protein [Halovivax gelatinilyticus]
MRGTRGLLSTIGGRRILLTVGAFYVVLATVRAGYQLQAGAPLLTTAIITTFVGGSGLTVFVGAYRLPTMDVHPSFYARTAGWTFVGIGAMLGLLALYHVQPGTGISEPNRSVPILTGFAAVAGFGVGANDALARTSTLELERQNRELQRMHARFEASNERLEQFAYAASHDLQEPLRMVSSYLKLIDSRYGDDLDDDGREFLEYAIDGADRMREMIEGLLEYSRIDTQGEPFEPVDLDSVLAAVRKNLELRIDESDATIEADSLPRVEGDERQLRQLFQNLIANAIEYSDDPPRIEIDAERDGDGWIVSVRDEGIGIDPDDQERIFEVFQRLHGRDEHPGTGIGLALCQRIVERHGGEIRVDSKSGEGTTVAFTIPAVTADGPTEPAPLSNPDSTD